MCYSLGVHRNAKECHYIFNITNFKKKKNPIIYFLTLYIDLVPREAAEKWLKYLREELPAVAFKCSTQEQKSNLGWKSSSKAGKTTNLLQTSDCLGAENLIKLLKNYSRSHEVLLGSISLLGSHLFILLLNSGISVGTSTAMFCAQAVLLYFIFGGMRKLIDSNLGFSVNQVHCSIPL